MHPSETPGADLSPEQAQSLLFLQLVSGHSQMALMLMGRLENPHTGEFVPVEPEGARVFMQQLVMLKAKTQGNLSPEETQALEEALDVVQATFNEVVGDPH